jgi:purine-cytosine permease-like protein
MCYLKPSTTPTLALAGLLGTLSGVATPRKLSKNFWNFVVVINHCIVIPFAFDDLE